MNFQFTNPEWLLALPVALAWSLWFGLKTDVQTNAWRRWTAFSIRMVIVLALCLAIAGLQWKHPIEGMNVLFVLDRSDSIPAAQQEAARIYLNQAGKQKKHEDKGGVLVFGSEASIEAQVQPVVEVQKIQAVVGSDRTDLASAIRLGTAAFPENGQKRLVLLTDGNENFGDAMAAAVAAKPLGVSIDVVPLGVRRGGDVSVQKVSLPNNLKKGQTFEVKIFVQADEAQRAKLRLYRNDQLLGEQPVELEDGKNLFTFPQTLPEAGYYSYDVRLEADGDTVPQNNRASGFTYVKGDPRVLLVSADPKQDETLVAGLRSADLEVRPTDVSGFPTTLGEMQSYDTIFISNIAAGDLGDASMKLLESAVRDFGVGLVCVGGDQTYAAGGYRGTPLESTLPVDMELSSKKVLPNGALVLVVHATEFPNGNQWARDIAFAALDALGPQDEMGIVLWDGSNRWLFPLTKVGDKKDLGRKIMGMNPGDMGDFVGPMQMAHADLKKSNAQLKHMVVFSDGDPHPPTQQQLTDIVSDRITISTVMIGGHVQPDNMVFMAEAGHGRFYDVRSPGQLPQIFIKEAAVILKSAIFEEPFKPRQASGSELLRGIGSDEYRILRGYVATTPKPRAEIPLVSDKGDPILAHWQYGLGRAVAFTSDAKAKWAADWLTWDRYRQFWSQIAKWSLRRIENSELSAGVTVDQGEGVVSVEAMDAQGNFRNFLNLQTVVVGPKGDRQTVRLEQTGPGHYEARFPAREVGGYVLNLADLKDGQVRSSQVLGASVNYSPEFNTIEPNLNLLQRLAETGGGKILDPNLSSDNPFLHDRKKTFQPLDLFEWLMKLAILLFPLDVGIRRVQLDRDEWLKATATLRRFLFPWIRDTRPVPADPSLSALLSRRERVRTTQTAPSQTQPRPELFRPTQPVKEMPEPVHGAGESGPPDTAAPTPPGDGTPPAATESTATRLLEAKRRAQRRN